jgi:hypothetical protein
MQKPPTATSTHLGQNLAQALNGSESLAGLLARMQQSQARLALVAPLLPLALRSQVRAGPVDDKAWDMLVDNAAAAAKLRQMLPSLQAALAQGGWPEPAPRVRIQPRPGPAGGARPT